jgi:hypothetical protein
MELLLVLAILVAVAAVSAPSLTGVMRNVKLNSAADIVRTEWTKAHVRAMKTGRIQVFRYEVGGTKFTVQPWIAGDDSLESDAASQEALAFGSSTAEPTKETGAEQELPEGTLFVMGDAQVEGRSLKVAEQVVGMMTTEAEWSPPILFYPDGSSSDAFVVVGDDRETGIRLELRGMTGAVKVGEIASLEDVNAISN